MIILEHEDYKVIKIEPKMVDAAIPLITPLLSLSIPYTSEFSSLGDLLRLLKELGMIY